MSDRAYEKPIHIDVVAAEALYDVAGSILTHRVLMREHKDAHKTNPLFEHSFQSTHGAVWNRDPVIVPVTLVDEIRNSFGPGNISVHNVALRHLPHPARLVPDGLPFTVYRMPEAFLNQLQQAVNNALRTTGGVDQ